MGVFERMVNVIVSGVDVVMLLIEIFEFPSAD